MVVGLRLLYCSLVKVGEWYLTYVMHYSISSNATQDCIANHLDMDVPVIKTFHRVGGGDAEVF